MKNFLEAIIKTNQFSKWTTLPVFILALAWNFSLKLGGAKSYLYAKLQTSPAEAEEYDHIICKQLKWNSELLNNLAASANSIHDSSELFWLQRAILAKSNLRWFWLPASHASPGLLKGAFQCPHYQAVLPEYQHKNPKRYS